MTIRSRLTLNLSLVTIIPLLLITFGISRYAQGQLAKFILERVESVNTLKANSVTTFFDDRIKNVRDLKASAALLDDVATIARLIDSPNDPAFQNANHSLNSTLQDMRKLYEYEDVKVLGSSGRILYVANPDSGSKVGSLTEGVLAKVYEQGQKGFSISDVFAHETSDPHKSIFFANALKDKDGLNLGVIVFESEMDGLFQSIQDVTGLSKTGETFLGKDDGYSVLILTSLRYDSAAALTRRITYGEKNGGSIQRATRGKTGRGASIDYAGNPVLAAWRYLPEVNWGIVTKIETSEALSTMTNIQKSLYFVVPIFILFVVLFINLITYLWLTRPLRRLNVDAKKISLGDYNVRIDHSLLYGHGDISQLATHLHNIANRFRYHYEHRPYVVDDEEEQQFGEHGR